MNIGVAEIRLNVRTTTEIKRDIAIAARLRGMTVSSLINSLAVKAIREEKNLEPEAFERVRNVNEKTRAAKNLAPVVATITPAVDPKDEVRQMVNAGTQSVPVLKRKVK